MHAVCAHMLDMQPYLPRYGDCASSPQLMSLSAGLASLNHGRFADFPSQPTRIAAAAFEGPAYKGLDAASLDTAQLGCACLARRTAAPAAAAVARHSQALGQRAHLDPRGSATARTRILCEP